MSKIEWTEKTWNPITGCTKKSAGCRNCYAEVMARRLKGMGMEKYRNGFDVTLHEDDACEPFAWKKPCKVFVCSMSDIFHEDVPIDFVDLVVETMRQTLRHQYQILTKRAHRMREYVLSSLLPRNVWLGVTVECKDAKYRIDCLRDLDVNVKFLSCEPLIEDLGELDLSGIDWVIAGGESGTNARPMKEEWVMNIKEQCDRQGVSFFFKQWGTWGADGVKRSKKENGCLLNGEVVQNYPKYSII